MGLQLVIASVKTKTTKRRGHLLRGSVDALELLLGAVLVAPRSAVVRVAGQCRVGEDAELDRTVVVATLLVRPIGALPKRAPTNGT